MHLTSPSFKTNGGIPKRYSGEGKNFSPPLDWSGVPEGCREFVLICEDPDAPKRPGSEYPFVHWIVYGISPETTALPEGVLPQGSLELPVRLTQGTNSFQKIGYDGPMPPVGHGTHHYIFTLYALDSERALKPGATRQELLDAMKGHVLVQAELTGTYKREVEARARFKGERYA